MKVGKDFYFEAAHYIPGHETCGQMHGHSYKLRIVCEGPVLSNGMVMDFKELKNIVTEEVVQYLDHKTLNPIIELPTAEFIVDWIRDRLIGKIPLKSITLWETRDSYAEFSCY